MSARLLDLTLPAGRGLTLRIVERPGLTLGPRALARLLADLRSVAERVLPGGELRYGVLSGDHKPLETTIITLVQEARTGRPVAFSAMAFLSANLAGRPIDILHLGLVMVDPAFRGRGLSERLYGFTCLALFLRRRGRPLRLSSVTQVPAVVGMVAETFDDVFPTPRWPEGPSFVHRFLAKQIMARHREAFGVGDDAWFDDERSIIRNAYTGGSDALKKTFEAAPKHRDRTFDAFCADSLDYARGDDFLQIGEINAQAAGRWLDRIARPASATWLAGHLALFALRRAVLPLVRSLDEIRHWQERGAHHPWKHARP